MFYLLIFIFCFFNTFLIMGSLSKMHFNLPKFTNSINFVNISLSASEKLHYANFARSMFEFAYHSYLNYAYPYDELNPIDCVGRGYDFDHKENININDVLGNYQLTLIESLDGLAIMGKVDDFKQAVMLLMNNFSFENNRVQLFEANIRIIGGLISAHLLITDPKNTFGHLKPSNYNGELLNYAHVLADKMLDAFQNTKSGLPYPRFYLQSGLKDNTTHENCLAGAGTFLLEFGCLSALVNNSTYATLVRQIMLNLWSRRSNSTGLLGSTIDVTTGEWINEMSGLGAGQDSFYEYLQKAYILFGDNYLGRIFSDLLETLKAKLRTGRATCLDGSGPPPVYWNVNMNSGKQTNYWIDSLQASWSAVLVLHGDVDEAICHHALHYHIWKLFDLSPERYNLIMQEPELLFYPLRPELAESTYFLYRATKHPFYLDVGKLMIDSFNKHVRTKCGFATIHNVLDKTKEDRMESFFLSETLKYLYLLFDESNPLNRNEFDYVFSTQGHFFPISRIRHLISGMDANPFVNQSSGFGKFSCPNWKPMKNGALPLDRSLWHEVGQFVNTNYQAV